MKTFIQSICLLFCSRAFACVFCNKDVMSAIDDSTNSPNLIKMLSAFIVLTIIVLVLLLISNKKHKTHSVDSPTHQLFTAVPLASIAIIIGIGLGGFIDGIVFHQILQWHEMLSYKIPATNYIGKSVNMFWDGIFHAFCFIVVLIGIFKLYKLLKRTDINTDKKVFWGGILFGWGFFNVVEGVINHHILKLHNVREFSSNPDFWNFAFLGISVILMIIGYVLIAFGNRKYLLKR